jgi:hypothetical protein
MATPQPPSLKRPVTAVDDAESETEEGELSDDEIIAPAAPKSARTARSQVSAHCANVTQCHTRTSVVLGPDSSQKKTQSRGTGMMG